MRWFLSLLLIPSPGAWGATVLFQAPTSSNIEYRAMIKGRDEFTSPSQVYLAQHPGAAAHERLLLQFSEAQKAFVSPSPEEAKRQFRSVAEMLTEEDWGPTDREVLFTALLRLAQLENPGEVRDAWLNQALLLGPDLKADRTLFPPPLCDRVKQLEKQASRFNPAQSLEGVQWSRLLVNGVSCTALDCPSFPLVPGRLRLTFVSDKWWPQTLVIESGAFDKIRPERVAWVHGSCEQPTFSASAQAFAKKQAFFALECSKGAAIDTIPALHVTPPTPELAAFTQALPTPRTTPFYESKWFWVGAGSLAVAAIVIIAHQNKSHEEEREPTTSYGN